LQIGPEFLVLQHFFWFGKLHHLLLPGLPLRRRLPGFAGRLECHAKQPVRKQLRGSDRGRLADEDEERGLKGVLGVVMAGKGPATDAPDHRPMP
jgi:hypothetical protein